MNKLISDFTVLYTKLHTFHYNVVGSNFASVHVMLEGEYDAVHNWIDEAAEGLKMADEFPVPSLKEMLELSTIKEAESKDYTPSEIINELIGDYEALIAHIEEIKDELPFYQTNFLEDVETHLVKAVWFFKATLK